MNPHLDLWPELPLGSWQDTYDTLHMWTQIVGKIRMTLTPLINHYWNATLYVSARGLTTSAIPYPRGVFEMEFDFIGHKLAIRTSEGDVRSLDLAPPHRGRLLCGRHEHTRRPQNRREDSRAPR